MNRIITDNQLWLSGTSSEIRAQLRRMVIKAGKDTKMINVLQQPYLRKLKDLGYPHTNMRAGSRSKIR